MADLCSCLALVSTRIDCRYAPKAPMNRDVERVDRAVETKDNHGDTEAQRLPPCFLFGRRNPEAF